MAIISQTPEIIANIFKQYGDSYTGRKKVTDTLRLILQRWYGEGYAFNFYGNAVDSNGHITKYFIDTYNTYGQPPYETARSTDAGLEQIENLQLVNIAIIKQKSPIYVYPWYYEYRLLPYNAVDRHLFLPKGIQNLKYGGSKLTGASINSNSTQTIDGGPVVKVTRVNQNQVVFSNNTVTTARANTSGLPVRILTSADTGRLADTTSNARIPS